MTEQCKPLELARRYRPQRFGDVCGQKPSVAVLYRMAYRGSVPGALLLYGERGCGKTTLARILAAALNCHAEPGPASEWPCGKCPSCEAVADGTSPDVMEVDAASNGSVEQIRRIRDMVNYGTGGNYRVVLLDEAHGLSDAAFQALLKTLEEPPPSTVFVLLTTKPSAVPAPITSRCSQFSFHPFPPQLIAERLAWICETEGIAAETELLAAIAESARGGMRDAINRLDQVASVGISSAVLWRELTGVSDFAPGLLNAAASGDHPELFRLLDAAQAVNGDAGYLIKEVIRCLRDVLVLSDGAQIPVQGEALAVRRRLAERLGTGRVVAAMQVLWDLQTRVHAEDRSAGLALALVMVSRKLCSAPQAGGVQSAAGGNPASFADLKSMFGSEVAQP
jgi:DNA polymerase III subunit gamma/tau